MPKGLDAAGRALFRALAKDLQAGGLYSPMDGLALALAVQHYQVAQGAAAELRKDGLVVDGHRGADTKHPASSVLRMHSAAYLELAKQFGLVPVARLRTTITIEESDTDEGLFDT